MNITDKLAKLENDTGWRGRFLREFVHKRNLYRCSKCGKRTQYSKYIFTPSALRVIKFIEDEFGK